MSFVSHVISDYHLDRNPDNIKRIPVANPDVPNCIIAGDIGDPTLHLVQQFYQEVGRRFKIYVVAGNWEYYNNRPMYENKRLLRKLTESVGGIFLDDSSITVNGVELIGSTLWCDVPRAMKDVVFKERWGYSHDVVQHLHTNSRAYLDDVLETRQSATFEELSSRAKDKARILITHYPISRRFITADWKESPRATNQPAGCEYRYFNNLDYMLSHVDVCVAGHTHYNSQFQVRNNPRQPLCIQNSVGHSKERSGFNAGRFFSVDPSAAYGQKAVMKSVSDLPW